jgi:hypothetical protein
MVVRLYLEPFRGGWSRFRGKAILVTACLQKNFFFAGKEDVAINWISRWNGT